MQVAGALGVCSIIIVMGMAVIMRRLAWCKRGMPSAFCCDCSRTMGQHIQRWRERQPYRQAEGGECTDQCADSRRKHHGRIAKTFLT